MNNVKSADEAAKQFRKTCGIGGLGWIHFKPRVVELIQQRDAEVWQAACEHCAGIVGSNTTNLLALRQQLLAAKNDMPKQQAEEEKK